MDGVQGSNRASGLSRVKITRRHCTRDAAAEVTKFHVALAQVCVGIAQQTFIRQGQVLKQMLVALFTGGHVLMEGMPGLGRTLMASVCSIGVNWQEPHLW